MDNLLGTVYYSKRDDVWVADLRLSNFRKRKYKKTKELALMALAKLNEENINQFGEFSELQTTASMFGKKQTIRKHNDIKNQAKNVQKIAEEAEQQYKQLTYEEKKQIFFSWLGKETPNIEVKKIRNKKGKNKRYIVISDLHLPYIRLNALRNILDKEAPTSDGILIAGDVFDFESLSKHRKFKDKSLKEELAESRVIIEFILSYGLPVKWVGGNHDVGRYTRVLESEVPEDLRFLMTNPFEWLLADLNDFEQVGQSAEYSKQDILWFSVIGKDAYIAHFEKTSTHEGKNAKDLKDWLEKWRHILKVPEPKFIATGHSHRSCYIPKNGYALFDTGSLVSLEGVEYSIHDTKGMYQPPVTSYVILTQDEDGNTILPECTLHFVE